MLGKKNFLLSANEACHMEHDQQSHPILMNHRGELETATNLKCMPIGFNHTPSL